MLPLSLTQYAAHIQAFLYVVSPWLLSVSQWQKFFPLYISILSLCLFPVAVFAQILQHLKVPPPGLFLNEACLGDLRLPCRLQRLYRPHKVKFSVLCLHACIRPVRRCALWLRRGAGPLLPWPPRTETFGGTVDASDGETEEAGRAGERDERAAWCRATASTRTSWRRRRSVKTPLSEECWLCPNLVSVSLLQSYSHTTVFCFWRGGNSGTQQWVS